MQVLHGNRTMYNVRNGQDLARFLATPVKEDVEAHLENLRWVSCWLCRAGQAAYFTCVLAGTIPFTTPWLLGRLCVIRDRNRSVAQCTLHGLLFNSGNNQVFLPQTAMATG